MTRVAIPLHSAENRNPQVDSQRLLNMYVEQASPTAKSQIVLHGTPGFSRFASGADVNGMYNANGTLYVATPIGMFRVESSGNRFIQEYKGEVGERQTTITWNRTDFYCQPDTGAAFIDGYFIRMNGGGQIAWTSPYTTAFDPLDFATAEGAPDHLVGILGVHRELWLFGKKTVEVWFNSGDPDQTFQRIDGAFMEYGAVGGIAALDNTVFWAGDDGQVYTAAGFQPQPIATNAICKKIAAASGTPIAWTYNQEGHGFYVLVYDDLCVVFDTDTGAWHERSQYGRDSIPYVCHAEAYGSHYVGGPDGIYKMGLDLYTDDGTTIEREIITPPLYTDDARVWSRCSSLELLLETGQGLTTGQGSDPQVMLQLSDDGSRTWKNERWRSAGKIGEYRKRAKWKRNGRFRERSHKFRMSDPIKWSVIGLNADIE